MRTSHAVALLLGVAGLGTACGDGNGPSNTPPSAAFTPSCVLLVCTFADSSTDADGQVTAYTWNFGDGTAAAITKDVVHTYATANTYAVSLTVTDNDGATADVTESVLVHLPANLPPVAGFTSSCTELACSFAGHGSDGDGTVVGFRWEFGDGAEAVTQNATHTYASTGTYTVALTVTDDSGAEGRVSEQVTVTEPPAGGPTADFAGACVAAGGFGRIRFFDCTVTDQSTAAAGATVTAWAWDFGDGRTSTEQNPPVHRYTVSYRPGIRIGVRLTVTDDNGRTNEVTRSIPLSIPAPQTGAPTIALAASPWLRSLCYPARAYSTRGCPSGGYVAISNTGGEALTWTATRSATWLKISPSSGTAPSTMTVRADGTGLPRGIYSGSISIRGTGATNSPQTVSVTMQRW